MVSYIDFKNNIYECAEDLQNAYGWRIGQAVFNLLDLPIYGYIARDVAEYDNIDCFCDDREVNRFIGACWKRYYDKKQYV